MFPDLLTSIFLIWVGISSIRKWTLTLYNSYTQGSAIFTTARNVSHSMVFRKKRRLRKYFRFIFCVIVISVATSMLTTKIFLNVSHVDSSYGKCSHGVSLGQLNKFHATKSTSKTNFPLEQVSKISKIIKCSTNVTANSRTAVSWNTSNRNSWLLFTRLNVGRNYCIFIKPNFERSMDAVMLICI